MNNSGFKKYIFPKKCEKQFYDENCVKKNMKSQCRDVLRVSRLPSGVDAFGRSSR